MTIKTYESNDWEVIRIERRKALEAALAENKALRSAFASLRDKLTEVSLQAEDAVIAINMGVAPAQLWWSKGSE